MTEGIGSALTHSMLVSLIQTEGAAKSSFFVLTAEYRYSWARIGHAAILEVYLAPQCRIRDDTELHLPGLLCCSKARASTGVTAAPSFQSFAHLVGGRCHLARWPAALRSVHRLLLSRFWRYLLSLLPWRANRARSAPPPPRTGEQRYVGGGVSASAPPTCACSCPSGTAASRFGARSTPSGMRCTFIV